MIPVWLTLNGFTFRADLVTLVFPHPESSTSFTIIHFVGGGAFSLNLPSTVVLSEIQVALTLSLGAKTVGPKPSSC